MSQITVQMYGTLRKKVDKGKISINVENVKFALKKLANQFARKFRVQFYMGKERLKVIIFFY